MILYAFKGYTVFNKHECIGVSETNIPMSYAHSDFIALWSVSMEVVTCLSSERGCVGCGGGVVVQGIVLQIKQTHINSIFQSIYI